MSFLQNQPLEDRPSIPEYYRGKTIFITGGSGFLGKLLVEKLLYSCQDLDRIYLLLRPKKGVTPEDRLSDIYDLKLFDRLRKERPGSFKSKVRVLQGDCSELGLGLSEEERALVIDTTHIIYHAAASVRFDDSLKESVKLNLRGTKEIIELAKNVKKLECFVHVSTSYANANRDLIEEVMYPPHADWRETLEICESMDDHTLNVLTPKYLGDVVNTYVFAKQLAEHVVYEQRGKLPIVILRPSIVISTHYEPLPGWIENFNGPIGLMVATGKGFLRIVYADREVAADFIPADLVIKGFIIASWIRGTKKLESNEDIPIYNTCNGEMGYRKTYGEVCFIGNKILKLLPLDNMIWSVGDKITKVKSLYYIQILLLHVLPAILLDTLLWACGKNRIMLKIQRRIFSATIALQTFLTKVFTFTNNNFLSLRSKLKEEDKENFYYDMENIDAEEYLKNGILGARRYLLNEPDENLPKAQIHRRRIGLLDKIVKCVFFGFIVWRIMQTDFIRNVFVNL